MKNLSIRIGKKQLKNGKMQPQRNGNNKRGTTPTDQLLGQRIRARRLEQHISQSELSDKLGVSFQQVQKYEKGVNRVGSARLMEIAAALDTDMAYFIGDLDGKPRGPTAISRFMATKDGIEIMEAMMKLDNADLRRSVIDLARKLGNVYGEQAR